MRIPYISLLAAGALALSGCAYGDLGLGIGTGYGGYYGAGYGYPYGAYGGYGYGMPYYGWYDDFYYPGTGIYVYDSYRRPHMWSDRQRNYWTSRQQTIRTSGTRSSFHDNWSGFSHRDQGERRGRPHG